MRWAFPYAFLLLLGAVPLILFLHSLRPKAFKVKTTTLFLWERVLKERPIGKKLGWLLRNNLLLMLQLLIALILIAALADPALLHYGVSGGDIVAVVDLSASMKARGRAGSRFDAARREFFALIDAMASEQKMMVIGAGPTPRLLSPFSADKKKLKELGRNLQPTDAPAQVKDAVLFAHSFLKRGSRDQVIVLSDGAFDGAEKLPWHSAHLRLVRVEGGSDNVGITGFELRRVAERPRNYELMVSIRNFTPRSVQIPLTLTMGEKKWMEERVEIGPEETKLLIYPYQGVLEGRATAHLAVEDDLATDNRAYLALSESPTLRLLYAGKGNPFLEHLFRSLPNIQVTSVDRLPTDATLGLKGYDVILLDGIATPPLVEGNFLLINTIGPGLPLSVGGKIQRPRSLPLTTSHPLTEGVRLEDLYIKEALRLIPSGEGVTLARSREGPLIFAIERGRLRSLVFGFDLLASDLPYRVAFPLLLHNALEWFQPKRVEFPANKVQAGAVYALNLHGTDDQVEVQYPAGKREILRVASNPLPFADTFDTGFYTFKSQSRAGQFAVNLFSESESQISPRILAQDPVSEKRGDGERSETGFSLWPFLLILVFILLAVEAFLVFKGVRPALYPLVGRLLALSALVFAIVNPKIFKGAEALDVILQVDFSRSVGQLAKEKALEILEEARRFKRPETRTGLLFFGREPAWEVLPRTDLALTDFSPGVIREETDIQAALQAALAQVGDGRQGKILLISDGNENRGEVSRVAPLLRSHGVPVWILPVNPAQGKNEVYLSDLVVPRQVDSRETFEVRGAIESLSDAPARVKLLRNGVIQKEETPTLRKGTNWVSFRESLKDRGNHTYEFLVESAQDTLPENNLLQGVVEVKGAPRVLYLHAHKDAQRFFSRALALQGYSVIESTPEEILLSLPDLSAFDLLVLDNVPAHRLSQAKMEVVERYVRDLGGGMIVIGGTQSYGAGGYYKTPLERLLPVEMRPPSRLDLPQVALLFVLDKSGSMGAGPPGATKLDLAKGAAFAAADLLNPADQVGILAFDAGWDWALPFRAVGKGELISERLASLQSDGGTDLYKAMVEAQRAFSTKAAAIKHILVLSDGLTDKADFKSLVEKMAQEKITVSTVALGQDADMSLMTEIAKYGKGRGYITVDPKTIPQIFTAETLLISRDLLIEKLIYPKLMGAVGPLKGFYQKKIPPVRGYVLTHPKPHTDLLMKAEDDPLLISWRYGLGKVVAFTSDLSGQWGRDWVGWEDFPQLASQLARNTMKRVSENRIRTEFQQQGEEVRAVVDLLSKEGGFINHVKLKANLAGPDQTSLVKSFQQTAPGRYETHFSTPKRGIYLLTVHEEGEKSEGPSTAATVPFIAPYPREYRELKPNMALLNRLAEETGGEVLDPDKMEDGLKRLYTPDPSKAKSAQETWWLIAAFGLLLFLADLAFRRLPSRLRA